MRFSQLVMKASIASAFLAALQSASPSSASEPVPDQVSAIALVANPRSYDGQLVLVIGYVHFEFEGNSLCVHQQDQAIRISRNCLWLDASAMPESVRTSVQNKYAIVEGRFSSEDHGHMSMFSGAIREVSRLEPWERTQ